MPIGNEQSLNAGVINDSLGALAKRWHELANDTVALFQTINQLQPSGMETAPIGMQPQDATDTFNAANYFNTCALIYLGQATQMTDFDFDTVGVIIRARGLMT